MRFLTSSLMASALVLSACALDPAEEEQEAPSGGKADGQTCTVEGYKAWLSGYTDLIGSLSRFDEAALETATAAAASQPCGEPNDEAYDAWNTTFLFGSYGVEGWEAVGGRYEDGVSALAICIGDASLCLHKLLATGPTDAELRGLQYLLLARPPGGVAAQRQWLTDYAAFADAAGKPLKNPFGVAEAAYTLNEVELPLLEVIANARPQATQGDSYAQWLAVFDASLTGATSTDAGVDVSTDERAFLDAIAITKPCGTSSDNLAAFEAFAARFSAATADVTDAIDGAAPSACEAEPSSEPGPEPVTP